ncbi:MAG: hypothetical protein ABIP51_11190 [Bacteroidia bacterium]
MRNVRKSKLFPLTRNFARRVPRAGSRGGNNPFHVGQLVYNNSSTWVNGFHYKDLFLVVGVTSENIICTLNEKEDTFTFKYEDWEAHKSTPFDVRSEFEKFYDEEYFKLSF